MANTVGTGSIDSWRQLSATISASGDFEIQTAYHDWVVRDGIWETNIHNSSGIIDSTPEIEFLGNAQPDRTILNPSIDDNTWLLTCEWEENITRKFNVIRTSYKINEGAIVSSEGMQAFLANNRAPGKMLEMAMKP